MAGSIGSSRSGSRVKRVGILIVSTGTLANSMRLLVQGLLGSVPQVKALCLRPEEHWGGAVERVRSAVTRLDDGSGVLVFADVPGGTPFNAAQSLKTEKNLEVIGGVNIPMLIKAAEVSAEMKLGDAASYIERYGRDHISRGQSRREGEVRGS